MILKGRAATDQELRQAILQARSEGHEITVNVTWESGDATRFATQAAEAGVDTVVAAGGDGTINEVVQGVIAASRIDCAVATIPMGTANDFASQAEIPADDPAAALDLILHTPPRRIDVGMINDRPFINVASGGVGAEIVAQTPAELKEMLGGVSYSLTGLANVLTLKPRKLSVKAPQFDWCDEAYVITVGNSRTAGGGYTVAPDAKLDDGLLDMMIVPRLSPEEFFRFVGQLLELSNGMDFQEIVRKQVPWVEVTADEPLAVTVDGEPMSASTFRFEILPKRLLFHLPETTT